jgi:hypothetical protein
MAEYY